MKTITNKGNKILHVGSLMLLPEESHELPKEYENNPVLDFFAKRGTICITEDGFENFTASPKELIIL